MPRYMQLAIMMQLAVWDEVMSWYQRRARDTSEGRSGCKQ
jgi:hypothetical protein